MRVLLYSKDYDAVKNSGVGKAMDHQKRALKSAGVDFTLDEKDDFDICHINTILPNSANFALKMKLQKKPVIYHAHSTKEDFKDSFKFSNQMAGMFKTWLMLCYNLSDLIITPTEYSKNLLLEYELKKPIRVISNGIDLDFWKKREGDYDKFIKRFNLNPSKKHIISVGLFINRKGILDFIELAKRCPEYEFIWFGKNDMSMLTKDVKKAMEEKSDNLLFPGYVDSETLRFSYCASDLFMFMTHEETEGIVLLEAMACKTPLLIRDIEIYKKDFEDGENIYKAKNIEEFYEKMKKILDHTLPDLTEDAYLTVKKKSIEHVGFKLKEAYEEVLKLKGDN